MVGGGDGGVDHQRLAEILRGQRHMGEVPHRVVRQPVEDVRVDRERADVAEDQRVLVFSARHLPHGDVAGRAGLVVDIHALAE